VKGIVQNWLDKAKRRIQRRLRPKRWSERPKPMLAARNIRYEVAERTSGLAAGGIGAMHLLAQQSGLVDLIDRHLHVLKRRLPYHESDHVLNVAYNILAGGSRIEHLELRRNDEVYLDALGAERIPDPTTAGVKFTFGIDASPKLKDLAENLPEFAFRPLVRPPKYEVQTEPRQRPANVKQQIVIDKKFENLRLEREDVAEVRYTPAACAKSYRLVVLRKTIAVERGQQRLLRMEFSTFVQAMIQIPCQIVRTGRRVVYRLLSWNPWTRVLLRLVSQLRRPLRC